MISKKDLLIISNLRSNARETLTTISKKTKIPISTIYDKLKFHARNLIIKNTALLDFARLGFNTRAKVMLKADREQRDSLKVHLLKNPNVNTVYKINNDFDFLVEVIFKNIRELDNFVENLDDKFRLIDKKVFHVVEDVKREEFMSDPDTIKLLW